jgi:RNA polymerase sigma-54 factor
MSAKEKLHDHLKNQVSLLNITQKGKAILRLLIAHIDENGFLSMSVEDIARDCERPLSVNELEEMLNIVQRLSPSGVGARDLQECLLLQIKEEMPYADLIRVLVKNHLEDIHFGRLSVICQKSGYDLRTIREGVLALKKLTPKPGEQFNEEG